MSRFTNLVGFLVAFLVLSCSNGGGSNESHRVVVLTPDEIGEIVLPPGAFEQEVLVTLPPSTTNIATTTSLETVTESLKNSDPSADLESPATSLAEKPATSNSTTSVVASSSSTTTTTTTTTTTQPTKETIPIAEEEENAGVKLMDTLDDFKSCLSSEGYSFIGLPNQEAGPEDPANNPDYLRALVLCNSRTNIASTFQEFQESRNELTPEEIREQNEQTIALGECLKGKGWNVGDLAPDENGLLNPSQFQSPDGSVNTDDIRSCASELSLESE